jgi:hypothetical protein
MHVRSGCWRPFWTSELVHLGVLFVNLSSLLRTTRGRARRGIWISHRAHIICRSAPGAARPLAAAARAEYIRLLMLQESKASDLLAAECMPVVPQCVILSLRVKTLKFGSSGSKRLEGRHRYHEYTFILSTDKKSLDLELPCRRCRA